MGELEAVLFGQDPLDPFRVVVEPMDRGGTQQLVERHPERSVQVGLDLAEGVGGMAVEPAQREIEVGDEHPAHDRVEHRLGLGQRSLEHAADRGRLL